MQQVSLVATADGARPGEPSWGWVLINGSPFTVSNNKAGTAQMCSASGSQRRPLLTTNFSGFYIIPDICILCIFTSLSPSYKHLVKDTDSCWQVEGLDAKGLATC